VTVRLVLTFLGDLFAVLPSRAPAEWEELGKLNGRHPTVILISGFAATERTVSIMRRRLIKDGFNVIVLSLDWHTLADGVRGLYRMAEKLSTVALRIRKDRELGRTRIHLVAHSAGGLVARYYVQLLGGSAYCDTLITLGTPHSGTRVAALGLFTHLVLKARCLFHMLPISPFIRRLNRAPLPRDFRLVSISSSGDYLCPRRTTRLPEALFARGADEVETLELDGLSHSDFLLSKESYRALRRFLPPTETPDSTKEPANAL
jgi:pimeloyl-ACP methyl ester carboxylesterase